MAASPKVSVSPHARRRPAALFDLAYGFDEMTQVQLTEGTRRCPHGAPNEVGQAVRMEGEPGQHPARQKKKRLATDKFEMEYTSEDDTIYQRTTLLTGA